MTIHDTQIDKMWLRTGRPADKIRDGIRPQRPDPNKATQTSRPKKFSWNQSPRIDLLAVLDLTAFTHFIPAESRDRALKIIGADDVQQLYPTAGFEERTQE